MLHGAVFAVRVLDGVNLDTLYEICYISDEGCWIECACFIHQTYRFVIKHDDSSLLNLKDESESCRMAEQSVVTNGD